MKICLSILLILSSLLLIGCRGDEVIWPAESEQVGEPVYEGPVGFYLLNEGNMGSNKATLDYYDCRKGSYTRNIYSQANPSMVQEMGDVGNDIKQYGSKLYAVINCSNLIEVMDAATAKHIGSIEVPNCRYLAFHEGFGYVTSYVGYVAQFDTATLQLITICHVGSQPDELEVAGSRLYVANSGGYLPEFDSTISVIDIGSMREVERIKIAPNLQYVRGDRYGNLWISSRGNYGKIPSRLFCFNIASGVVDTVDVAVNSMWMDGDSLYIIGAEWSNQTMSNEISYSIVDVRQKRVVNPHFLADKTVHVRLPYGIAVHPTTKDIYITDAKDYVTPGTLWCIGADGRAKWNVRTGDIPGHFALRQ